MSTLLSLSESDVRRFGSGEALIRDGLLGASVAESLLGELTERLQDTRPARVGRGVDRVHDPRFRGDETAWLEAPGPGRPASESIWTAFAQVQGLLNRAAWLGLESFQVQLAYYRESGALYTRHRDAFAGPGNRRVATAVYYLNPNWKPEHGGCLRVYGPTGPRDIEPRIDRLVLFASERVEHEVLPVMAPRVALTAWYERQTLLPLIPNPSPPTQAA